MLTGLGIVAVVLVGCTVWWLSTIELFDLGSGEPPCEDPDDPVALAAGAGDGAAIREALSDGRSPDGSGSESTPLICAIDAGHANVIDELVGGGASVDLAVGGRTPLGIAAENGDALIVRMLTQAGADLDEETSTSGVQVTPLVTASYGGHLDAVAELLAAGASPDRASAVPSGNFGFLLCDRIAEAPVTTTTTTTTTAPGDNPLVSLVCDPLGLGNSSTANEATVTPLLAGASGGHSAVVERLLDAGADPGPITLDRYTPLVATAYLGYVDTAAALRTGGADPDRRLDDNPQSAVEIALQQGHEDVVAVLTG